MYEARQNKEKVSRAIEITKKSFPQKQQTAISFGSNRILQKKTNIEFTTEQFGIDKVSCTVGKAMHATLDPWDVVTGSASSEDSVQTDLMRQIYILDHIPDNNENPGYKNSGNKYVKGHLLNHDLGGPGLCFYLFPITNHANSEHKNKVEMPVKRLLSKLSQLSDKNNSIKYSVKVQNETLGVKNLPSADFQCTVTVDNTEATTTISSRPDQQITAQSIGMDSFSKPLKAWEHKNIINRSEAYKYMTIDRTIANFQYLNNIAPRTSHIKSIIYDDKILSHVKMHGEDNWNILKENDISPQEARERYQLSIKPATKKWKEDEEN